ncbi:hypothetical protein B566_EDAN017090 [Ephemera danica]|nr:hypothetical protein B566_EDAN017090 [Ephemera danica]
MTDSNDVTAENFMNALDDGLVVCRLARAIQLQAKTSVQEGRAKGPVPTLGGRMWQNAAKRSFFSRDNTENFIRFCRQLGVHENLIFESDDLVMHAAPRSVVLCLLEVSRLAASRFGLEASGLVQLEREIAECASPGDGSGASPVPGAALSDSGLSAASLFSWRPVSPQPPVEDDKTLHCISSSSALSLGSPGSSGRWSRPGSADEDETDTWRARGTTEETTIPERTPSPAREEQRGLSELDRKVEQAARAAQRQCRCGTNGDAEQGTSSGKCEKLQVRRLGAGKYNIAGRNVFVRHFLERHDPCQVRVLPRGEITPRGLAGPANVRRQSSPAATQQRQPSEGFLHIRAKYRSPPPARS